MAELFYPGGIPCVCIYIDSALLAVLSNPYHGLRQGIRIKGRLSFAALSEADDSFSGMAEVFTTQFTDFLNRRMEIQALLRRINLNMAFGNAPYTSSITGDHSRYPGFPATIKYILRRITTIL